ncbi:MAG: penicillin-binding protein 1B [Pseudomonadales bacterium]
MAATKKRPRRNTKTRKKKPSIWQKLRRILLWLLLALVLCAVLAGFWMSQALGDKFNNHQWSIPAKVYGRPLELFVGSSLSRAQVVTELELLGYKRGSSDSAGHFSTGPNALNVYTRGFAFADSVEKARKVSLQWSNGKLVNMRAPGSSRLSLLRLEPLLIGGIYPGHNEDRLLISLDQTPKGMLDALLAVEDRSFYSHRGISLRGIARAMLVNIKQGRFTQGGSTITQQLVKNLFLTQDRSLARKISEIPMALMLERKTSKEKILQMFLNEVFLVQDGSRAVHGFALASQYFFNQPLAELLPHQYALLVGMIKGPSYFHPTRNPARAMARRNLVLGVMAEQGIMSDDEANFAKKLPLGLSSKASRSIRQPAYLDLVRRQLSNDYRLEDLQSDGLRIFTNFDPLVQTAAEKSLTLAFADINKRPAMSQAGAQEATPLEAAMIVTHSSTGDVLAIVGGKEPRYAGFNRALDAKRPVGSLIKPAIFLTALEQPDRYTLASKIEDEAFELPQPDGSVWSPNNFDKTSHGPVSLLEALSKSYNQASARLGLELGIEQVHATLRKLGVEGDIPKLPSLFLGSHEMALIDVAAMYQTLSSGGFNSPQRAIREIVDAQGLAVKHYGLEIEQQVPSDTLHLLHYALQETMRNGTGRSAYSFIPGSLASAGKTGTSNGQRDSWFAGFTGDYLAVVWMGNDDYKKTSITGSSGALRAWSYLFRDISRQPMEFVRPAGVSYAWTDRETGGLSAEGCENSDYIPYVSGTEPIDQAACARRSNRTPNWLKNLFQRRNN